MPELPSINTLKGVEEQVAAMAAAIGLAGGIVALAKSVGEILTDRSLSQRVRRNTQAITETLTRLRQLNEMNAANPSLTADSYRAQLLDDLQAESQSLDLTRTRLEWRKRRRRDDPSGMHRWLLLFRPKGITGWFLQSFFYGMLLVTVFLVREVGALRRQDITGWSTATVCWILFTLYVWNVALVHRHLKVIVHPQGRTSHDSGHGWWKKLLVLLPSPVEGSLVKAWAEPLDSVWHVPNALVAIMYYAFLLPCVFLSFYGIRGRLPLVAACILVAIFLAFSSIFAIHAFSRRELEKLSPIPEPNSGQASNAQ